MSTIPADRSLTTSAITAVDRNQITGDGYRIDFTAVGPGATPGTTTATYTITNTTTGVTSAPVTVPDFASDKPATIAVSIM